MFFKKLYVRIWLAVVLAVAVLTFLVGWAWRLAAEPPLREAVMRNEAGQIIGEGRARMMRGPGAGRRYGNGPEFEVRMHDGQTVYMHLPRPPQSSWSRPPFGFFWTLALVAIAVALATYPIIRKLTRRLELLQNGVEKWGEGDLSIRVPETGQDEVAFLATRFNHAAERIEALVKSRDALLASQKSLLANASHELRSPLTRIRMGLELMGEQAPTLRTDVSALPPEGAVPPWGGPAVEPAPTLHIDVSSLPPEGAVPPWGGPAVEPAPTLRTEVASPPGAAPGWKDEIERNIAELDQLIEEILLASRLDAREADLGTIESVDLLALAAEECARVDAELELQLGPERTGAAGTAALPVQGVTKLLRRALRNLLENARRHAAGTISVTLARTDGHALIRVCDRGPGVPLELRERIFEPFYRLPGASERGGGVGLGLALVKAITLRHGGTVCCESRPQGGSCFVVQLPLGPVELG